jgi:hypothetical protein
MASQAAPTPATSGAAAAETASAAAAAAGADPTAEAFSDALLQQLLPGVRLCDQSAAEALASQAALNEQLERLQQGIVGVPKEALSPLITVVADFLQS